MEKGVFTLWSTSFGDIFVWQCSVLLNLLQAELEVICYFYCIFSMERKKKSGSHWFKKCWYGANADEWDPSPFTTLLTIFDISEIYITILKGLIFLKNLDFISSQIWLFFFKPSSVGWNELPTLVFIVTVEIPKDIVYISQVLKYLSFFSPNDQGGLRYGCR